MRKLRVSKKAILDCSAILALLDEEPGADRIRPVLFHSIISTVTLAEAFSIFSLRPPDQVAALNELLFAIEEVVPFTADQAEIAGALRKPTKPLGLSLGDRACIALAISLGVEIYTADRVWRHVDVGLPIHLIR